MRNRRIQLLGRKEDNVYIIIRTNILLKQLSNLVLAGKKIKIILEYKLRLLGYIT